MSDNYTTVRQEAIQALDAGDASEAYHRFRSVLEYPARLESEGQWADALEVFARIGGSIAGEEFARVVSAVVAEPEKLQALYDLGYQLIEHGLPEIAATVLARANDLAPEQEPIVTELVAALERCLRSGEACRVLRAAPGLVQSSFLCQYLLAFNALMTGDLDEPRRLLPLLRQSHDPDHAVMTARIDGMLLRADALTGVSPLDSSDLRGWHFVLNGSLLLHYSPYGIEEMRGRYAYTQDAENRCLEGIGRLAAVLEVWQLRPPRVFLLPDQASTALGLATAQVLGVRAEPWPQDGSPAPGLMVTYDLAEVPNELLAGLYPHRPGQILWTHASCWTTEPAFGADVVTYLYQHNTSPWGERLRLNPETQQVERTPAVQAPAEELARTVVGATLDGDALADLSQLRQLAQAISKVQGEYAAGAFRTDGNRSKQWLGSPVPSNRFR